MDNLKEQKNKTYIENDFHPEKYLGAIYAYINSSFSYYLMSRQFKAAILPNKIAIR